VRAVRRRLRSCVFTGRPSVILVLAGLQVRWQRREPTFYQALISGGDETTKLEWVVDSDFRFFPTIRDDEFGYVLHPVDLAANKVMTAAGRRNRAISWML